MDNTFWRFELKLWPWPWRQQAKLLECQLACCWQSSKPSSGVKNSAVPKMSAEQTTFGCRRFSTSEDTDQTAVRFLRIWTLTVTTTLKKGLFAQHSGSWSCTLTMIKFECKSFNGWKDIKLGCKSFVGSKDKSPNKLSNREARYRQTRGFQCDCLSARPFN